MMSGFFFCVAFVGLYVCKWSIREWRGVTLILAINYGVRVCKKSVFVVNPHGIGQDGDDDGDDDVDFSRSRLPTI